MYELIYDFLANTLIGATDTNALLLAEILTHTSIILIFIVLVLFIISTFKFVLGLFTFRG